MDIIPIWLQTCVLATILFFENPNIFPKKIHDFFETRIWGRLEYGWSVPWVQIPFKIHANRGVLDQICVVGPESGRGQSILGLLRVLRIPRHRFGTTRMPQPTFCFRPLRISLVNLNPWNPYYRPVSLTPPLQEPAGKDLRVISKNSTPRETICWDFKKIEPHAQNCARSARKKIGFCAIYKGKSLNSGCNK